MSFSKGYKIQSVNKLDFGFKVTAATSEAILRYLILRTLNVLYFYNQVKYPFAKINGRCALSYNFTGAVISTATTGLPPHLNSALEN